MTHFLVAAQHRADSPFNVLEDPSPVWADLTALDAAMREADVYVFSRGLQAPDAAVTFHAPRTGAVFEQAGPYGPSTLAGLWIIDCATEGEAREWARRCAEAHRCDVELRPMEPHVSEYLEGPT